MLFGAMDFMHHVLCIVTGLTAKNALVLGRFIANTSGKVKSLYDGTREGKPYELVSGLQVRSEATIAGVWC